MMPSLFPFRVLNALLLCIATWLSTADPVFANGDSIPPSITPPANVGVVAVHPLGAIVTYPEAVVTDAGSGVAEVTYSRSSGVPFPVGTTIVTITATDLSNNVSMANFNVTVLPLSITRPRDGINIREDSEGVVVEGFTGNPVTGVSVTPNGGAPIPATLTPSTAGRLKWQAVLPNPLPGANTLLVTATNGTGNVSAPPVHFTYDVQRPLVVTVDPPGSGTVVIHPPRRGGKARVGNNYTVEARPGRGYLFDHWSGKPSGTALTTTFTAAEGDVVNAHFVLSPFTKSASGDYMGVVRGTGPTGDIRANTGLMTSTISLLNGALSGRVILDGTFYAFSGVLSPHTLTYNTPLPNNGLAFQFTLNIAGAVPKLEGNILKRSAGSTTATIPFSIARGYSRTDRPPVALAVPFNAAFGIPTARDALTADQIPGGHGFGVVAISKADGTTRFTGILADGTGYIATGRLGLDGTVPVFAPFPGGTGLLAGNLVIDQSQPTTDVTGTNLAWYRGASSQQHYGVGYGSGLYCNVFGAKQFTSSAKTLGLDASITLTLSNGPFLSPVALTLNQGLGRYTSVDGLTTLSLGATGVVIGSYTPSVPTSRHEIKGIVIGKVGSQVFGAVYSPQVIPVTGTGKVGLIDIDP
ncbi:MAG: HYR domain-containing protein [Verrucomicrobiaceae bacterium]|nr:HYR domain-containing protein [Verrucomicrobiaceae bacterium]